MRNRMQTLFDWMFDHIWGSDHVRPSRRSHVIDFSKCTFLERLLFSDVLKELGIDPEAPNDMIWSLFKDIAILRKGQYEQVVERLRQREVKFRKFPPIDEFPVAQIWQRKFSLEAL